MTALPLFDEAPGVSLTQRLASYFTQRHGVWIDGRALATVAGAYGWRTRVSELRKAPFNLNITNRLRRCRREDGTKYTISEYRFTN